MPLKKKIRVLVVDDSLLFRRLLTDILGSEASIEIVGEAGDGVEAIVKASRLNPDVIIMDYNMPKANGAIATEKILNNKKVEKLPAIIILSSYSRGGIEMALESMRVGAVDVVSKPYGESENIYTIKSELITKIKVAARAHVFGHKEKVSVKKIKRVSDGESTKKLVAIGSSTGGPPVVERIVSLIPPDLDVAILVVQHMPKKFTKIFAEITDRNVSFYVKEAEDREKILPGTCYIAPGGQHMLVNNTGKNIRIKLNEKEQVNGYRPSVDVMMESAAEVYNNHLLGIVLTGMGSDGALGMKAIKDVGGETVVQSFETAVINSMPKSVINEGAADEVLDPDAIAKKIVAWSNNIKF